MNTELKTRKQGLDKARAVVKGWGARKIETVWHKTKGGTDYKIHEGKGELEDTI